MYLEKILGKKYLIFLWCFTFSRNKAIPILNYYFYFLKVSNNYLSSYSIFFIKMRRLLSLMKNLTKCNVIFLGLNSLYSIQYINKALTKYKKRKKFPSLFYKKKSYFIVVFNMHFNLGLLCRAKKEGSLIIGIVDPYNATTLVDYKFLFRSNSFYVMYFFVSFFLRFIRKL